MAKKEFKVEGAQDINPNKFGGMCSRAITLTKKEIDFEKGIDTIATTENPALVVDWERWQIVREILPMRYMEEPSNDKVPFLDSHSRGSLEKVKGSAREFRTEGVNLMAKVFVSKSEVDLRQKISEGHIDSVSIGYMTDKGYTVEVPKGASVTVDGVAYRNDYEDGIPLLVRTWWKTVELSGVAIGADELAKFKSIHDEGLTQVLDKLNQQGKEISELKEKMNPPQADKDKSARVRRLKESKIKLLNINI